jgi:putative membrane protein
MIAPSARRRPLASATGALVAVAAVIPPVHAAAEASLAAHMVQHLLLILAAAPLLAVGRPVREALRLLPPRQRRGVGRRVHRLGITARALPGLAIGAWIAHVMVLWAWHAPGLYAWALASSAGHALEHLSLTLTAYAFWWAALSPRILGPGGAVLYLFAAAAQGTALGALLVLADTPWYAAHAGTARDLTPLQDQQLAGLLMWIPGGLVYTGVALAIVAGVLRRDRPLPSGGSVLIPMLVALATAGGAFA